MTTLQPLEGVQTGDQIEIVTAKHLDMQRPWWAISRLITPIWCLAMATAAVVCVSMVITAIFLPSVVVGTICVISAIALAILVGGKIFETIRKAEILPDPLQYAAQTVHAYMAEFFSLIACSSLFLTGFFKSRPTEVFPDSTPVICIHGYAHNQSGWWYFKKRLKNAGIGPVYTMNLGNPFTSDSIENYADRVQEMIDLVKRETGAQQVNLIGHSMGGLVAAQAATTDERQDVHKIITLASPFGGTPMAKIGFGRCAAQMMPVAQNPFISDLRERVLTQRFSDIHSFYGRPDFVVYPLEAGFVKETPGVFFPWHGHLSHLFSDEVVDHVIAVLKEQPV